MERQLLTTISCTAAELRFHADYNPDWQSFISAQDFQLLLDHLNTATVKAPNRIIMWIFYILIFGAFITLCALGLTAQYSFWVLLIPFGSILLLTTISSIYQSESLTALDTALRKAVVASTEEITSPNILIQYSRNLYGDQQRNSGDTSGKKYDYIIIIYVLQSVTKPDPVIKKYERMEVVEVIEP
ncbi:hypothetical protein HDV06_005454 [Boothiomyces sp. JEL0866]|nr:hypothetical protein HDV06_005454 [Boothiomyces sp. JEL0866]